MSTFLLLYQGWDGDAGHLDMVREPDRKPMTRWKIRQVFYVMPLGDLAILLKPCHCFFKALSRFIWVAFIQRKTQFSHHLSKFFHHNPWSVLHVEVEHEIARKALLPCFMERIIA